MKIGAQAAVEYLLLLAAVVLVVAIVITAASTTIVKPGSTDQDINNLSELINKGDKPIIIFNMDYISGQLQCWNEGGATISCKSSAAFGMDANTSTRYKPHNAKGFNTPSAQWYEVDYSTGHDWAKTSASKNWIDANTYCAGLNWAGFDSTSIPPWGLPTLEQRFTTIDFNEANPQNSYSGLVSGGGTYWTQTADKATSGHYAVSYNSSDVNIQVYPDSTVLKAGCVRVERQFTFITFVNDGQKVKKNTQDVGGATYDSNTKLTWQQGDGVVKKWTDALTYCNDLVLATYTDWRVPNAMEWITAFDFNTNPASSIGSSLNLNLGSAASPKNWWTSTTNPSAGKTNQAYYYMVNSNTKIAMTGSIAKSNSTAVSVKCVRG